MLDFDKIRKEDVLGVVVCATDRKDFFQYTAKIVDSIYSKEDLGKFEDSKPYIVGTYKGITYHHLFFVKKDTPTFEYMESITSCEFNIQDEGENKD